MSIRIITDSTCDLSLAQLQDLDIDFIPSVRIFWPGTVSG